MVVLTPDENSCSRGNKKLLNIAMKNSKEAGGREAEDLLIVVQAGDLLVVVLVANTATICSDIKGNWHFKDKVPSVRTFRSLNSPAPKSEP